MILSLFVKAIPRVQLDALRGLLTGSGTVAYDIAGSNNLSGVQHAYFQTWKARRRSEHVPPVVNYLPSWVLAIMAYSCIVKASLLTLFLDFLLLRRLYSRETGAARIVDSKKLRMPLCAF
jgi:hypothetical protein